MGSQDLHTRGYRHLEGIYRPNVGDEDSHGIKLPQYYGRYTPQ